MKQANKIHKLIAICGKCHQECKHYSEEREADGDWVTIKYSECCDSEVIFFDNIKEVISLRLENDRRN